MMSMVIGGTDSPELIRQRLPGSILAHHSLDGNGCIAQSDGWLVRRFAGSGALVCQLPGVRPNDRLMPPDTGTSAGFHFYAASSRRKYQPFDRVDSSTALPRSGNRLPKSNAGMVVHVDAILRYFCRTQVDDVVESPPPDRARRRTIVRIFAGVARDGCGDLSRPGQTTSHAISPGMALGGREDCFWSCAAVGGRA